MKSQIEVVHTSKGWVIRRKCGPWSPEHNRRAVAYYEYWNGSWSLASFGDLYAIKYRSEQAACAAYLSFLLAS